MNITREQILKLEKIKKKCAPKDMTCIVYKIPMEYFAEVSKMFRDAGLAGAIKYRYRGPRKHSIGRQMRGCKRPEGGWYKYTRNSYAAQSNCLKSDAVYFSIYRRY